MLEHDDKKSSGPTDSSFLWMLPAAFCLFALLPLPYGYYTFLRIAVSFAAVMIAFSEYQKDQTAGFWTIIFVTIAILFNPIIPVYLSREIWFVIDLLTAASFVTWGLPRRNNVR